LTTVEDYSFEDGDIIDATQVTGLDLGTLEVRTATFLTPQQYDSDNTEDIVVQFAGGSGANLLLKGAGTRKETIAFDVTDVPLANQDSGYTSLKVNVHEGGIITASDEGEILVGGDGSQTLNGGAGNDMLLGGKGDDIIIGGAGADTFVLGSVTGAGIDIIRDFAVADGDVIKTSATADKAALGLTAKGDFTVGSQSDEFADLDAVLASFAANGHNETAALEAYTFTFDGKNYLLIDNGTVGYDAATDTLVEIAITGTLTVGMIFNDVVGP